MESITALKSRYMVRFLNHQKRSRFHSAGEYCNVRSVRNITARLLDAMTGKRWLAHSTDSSRVCQFDIDFYCSEFRLTRTCLVISLCLNIIYREMGRNLPVCEDVVQVVFTLRWLEPLSDRCSFREIKILGKVRIGCLF